MNKQIQEILNEFTEHEIFQMAKYLEEEATIIPLPKDHPFDKFQTRMVEEQYTVRVAHISERAVKEYALKYFLKHHKIPTSIHNERAVEYDKTLKR